MGTKMDTMGTKMDNRESKMELFGKEFASKVDAIT